MYSLKRIWFRLGYARNRPKVSARREPLAEGDNPSSSPIKSQGTSYRPTPPQWSYSRPLGSNRRTRFAYGHVDASLANRKPDSGNSASLAQPINTTSPSGRTTPQSRARLGAPSDRRGDGIVRAEGISPLSLPNPKRKFFCWLNFCSSLTFLSRRFCYPFTRRRNVAVSR